MLSNFPKVPQLKMAQPGFEPMQCGSRVQVPKPYICCLGQHLLVRETATSPPYCAVVSNFGLHAGPRRLRAGGNRHPSPR